MLIICRHFPLALIDRDGHRRLIVISGGKYLAFLGWNRRVAVDQSGEDTAQCFDTKRQWRHVKQQHIFHIAGQHPCLNRRARGNDLIRIDPAMWLCAKKLFHFFNDFRHAGHATDKDNLINL